MSNSYLLLSQGPLQESCSKYVLRDYSITFKSLCLENSRSVTSKAVSFSLETDEKKKKDTWAEMKIRAFVCFIGFLDWPCNMLRSLHFAQKVVKKRPLIPLFKNIYYMSLHKSSLSSCCLGIWEGPDYEFSYESLLCTFKRSAVIWVSVGYSVYIYQSWYTHVPGM